MVFSKFRTFGGEVTLELEYGTGLDQWSTPVVVPPGDHTVAGVDFNVTGGSPADTVIATIPTNGAPGFFTRIKAVK